MSTLTRTPDALEVKLENEESFPEALAKIKAVPGRRYDGDHKVWLLPAEVTVAERLMHTLKPSASPDIVKWVREAHAAQAAELTTPIGDDAKLLLPWADELMAHQRAAVSYLVEHPRCIVADEMGTGKTVLAIAAGEETLLRTGAERRPQVAVVPNNARNGWVNTASGILDYPPRKVWPGIPVVVLDGKTPKKRAAQIEEGAAANALIVLNWEKLRIEAVRKPLAALDLMAVYGDEIHRAKNRKTQQTKGLWKLQAPLQLGLSGTPLMNSPNELWSILRWLFPKSYAQHGRNGAISYWGFYDQYVEAYEGPWGKVITGVKNADALRFELTGRLIRRRKSEVLDLPGKKRFVVPVDLNPNQRKVYKEAETALWLEIAQAAEAGDEDSKRLLAAAFEAPTQLYTLTNGASRMVRLRQVACTPATLGGEDDSAKLDAAEEIITDAQPKQFVTFSEFREGAIAMRDRLRKHNIAAETFIGGDDYAAVENGFQAGDITVVCCTIAAGGDSINLTAADTAIFTETDWRPGVNAQAESRLDRQGQTNKVTIIILEARDTVDVSHVRPANELKAMIVGTVLPSDEIETEVVNG